MSLYHINEASFGLPGDFGDKTINIFSIPEPAGGQASLVITRDQLMQTLTLPRYGERILMEMEEKLHKFELVKRSEIQLSGIPAVQFDFLWVSDGTPMAHRQLVLLLPSAGCPGTVGLLVSFTGMRWTDLRGLENSKGVKITSAGPNLAQVVGGSEYGFEIIDVQRGARALTSPTQFRRRVF